MIRAHWPLSSAIKRQRHKTRLRHAPDGDVASSTATLALQMPFYGLLALGAILILSLAILTIRVGPLLVHEVVNLCRRSWAALVEHGATLSALIPLIGLGTMALVGIWALAQQLRATRRFLRSFQDRIIPPPPSLSPLLQDLGIAGRVDVVEDEQPYSFCYGLWRPRICVSTGLLTLLTSTELRALLVHERHHMRQRDPLRKLISRTLARALAPLPIADELAYQHRVAQEIAADRAAVQACGTAAPLAAALVKLMTTPARVHPSSVIASALSVTEARITWLLYGRKSRSGTAWMHLAVSALMVFAIALIGYAGWRLTHEPYLSVAECVNGGVWLG